MLRINKAEERSTVSLHEVKVWLVLRDKPDEWLTNAEIAEEAGVAVRTARQFTSRFVTLGLAERAETFPAYQFRLLVGPPNPYQDRIEAAIEPFGLGET